MNEIITDNKYLLYPKYKDTDYDINKEIYRGELYCNLLKKFSKSCLTNLNEQIFSHKKSSYRTITNLLSSWFFTLYQYYDFKDDPFYPTNYNYMDIIKKTIEDYSSILLVENLDIKITDLPGIESKLNRYIGTRNIFITIQTGMLKYVPVV